MVIFGWDLMGRREKVEALYRQLEIEMDYFFREQQNSLNSLSVVGDHLGFSGTPLSLGTSPEISVSQKIDVLCEYLNLEIVKEVREEKVVCRKREKK